MTTTKIPTVTIKLPTEVSYWGTEATPDDVTRILDSLEGMIRSEFGDRADLTIERDQTVAGSGIRCCDADMAEDIRLWIQDNWTAAL